MKIFEKIEEMANDSIKKIYLKLVELYFKWSPKSWLEFVQTIKNKRVQSKELVIQKAKNLKEFILKKKADLQSLKEKVLTEVTKLKNYPYKTNFLSGIKKFAQTSPKQHVQNMKSFLKKLHDHIKWCFNKLTEQGGNIAVAMFLGFFIYGISMSFSSMYEKMHPYRAPASVQKYKYHPDYRDFKARTMKVFNIKVPVFVQSVREIKSVSVGFSVRTNTQFSRLFLAEFEHKLKDHFFTSMLPIESSFLLKQEGKSVLKDKIIEELNLLLKEYKVEGEVLEIDINFIIAT